MNALSLNSSARMTSKEIADLVEKRHSNVKRTIETLTEKGLISKPQIEFSEEINNLGHKVKREHYVFDADHKRDTYVVVAQLSPEFTARIVDRWQELETGSYSAQSPAIEPLYVHAARIVPAYMEAARAFGFEGNQATLSANRAIKRFTGVNLLEAMGQTALIAPDQEPLLTASDIALRLSIGKLEANPLLIDCGLQTSHRDHKNRIHYELTEDGHKYGVVLDTDKKHGSGTPIRQIKWSARVLPVLEARLQVQNEAA